MKESLKSNFKAFISDKVTIGCLAGVAILACVFGYANSLPNYDKTKYDEWYPNGYIVFNDDIAEPIYEDYTTEENMRHNVIEYIFNKAIYDLYDCYSDNEELVLYNISYDDELCNRYNIAKVSDDVSDKDYDNKLLFIQIVPFEDRYVVKINNNDTSNHIDDYYYVDVKNNHDNQYTLDITKIESDVEKHEDLFDASFTNVEDYSNKVYNQYVEDGTTYLTAEGTDDRIDITLDYIRDSLFH